MGERHMCRGDRLTPESHECFCSLGRDHSAAEHRKQIQDGRYAEQLADEGAAS